MKTLKPSTILNLAIFFTKAINNKYIYIYIYILAFVERFTVYKQLEWLAFLKSI